MELAIENIEYSYNKKKNIIKGLSLKVQDGQMISVIGPNGCGKTTFIKCINRILNATKGDITYEGESIKGLKRNVIARKIGYVPQMTKEFASGAVIDAVIMGRKPYINWKLTDEDIDVAFEILRRLGIEHLANRNMEDLSGGQKQKVMIAIVLAQNPQIFLFDEPTSFLDIKNQVDIMKMARALVKEQGKTVIMVVHDLNMAFTYSDKILLMKEGRGAAFGTPAEVLTRENIKAVYDVDVDILDNRYIVTV